MLFTHFFTIIISPIRLISPIGLITNSKEVVTRTITLQPLVYY